MPDICKDAALRAVTLQSCPHPHQDRDPLDPTSTLTHTPQSPLPKSGAFALGKSLRTQQPMKETVTSPEAR